MMYHAVSPSFILDFPYLLIFFFRRDQVGNGTSKASASNSDLLKQNERIKSLEKEDLSSFKNKNDSETLLKINERLKILQEEERLLKLGKLGRHAEIKKNKNLAQKSDGNNVSTTLYILYS